MALAAYLRFLAENDLSVLDLNALEVAENSIVYAQDPDTGAWVEYDTFTGETDRMLGFLQDWLGISTLDPESDNALAPLVLGSQTNGISPLELAAAYAIFNEGVYTPPVLYTQVQDREGDLLLDRQGQRYARQAISPQTATIMNRLLQGGADGAQRHRPRPRAGGRHARRRQDRHHHRLPGLYLCGADALLRYGRLVGL